MNVLGKVSEIMTTYIQEKKRQKTWSQICNIVTGLFCKWKNCSQEAGRFYFTYYGDIENKPGKEVKYIFRKQTDTKYNF